jgi:PTS system galactitol-specific IIA component
VLKREEEFPTGLPTQGMAIALPHTEAQHVRQSCMAVGILENPVLFRVMGSPDQEIPVRGVFLLAIADRDSQVLALKQLADLFQDGVTLTRLAGAPDAERVLEALCEGVRHLEAGPAGLSRAS